jgi:hypothetical protein
MTMSASTRGNQCPDCGGSLKAITLFGRGPQNPLSGAATDAEVVYYANAQTKRSSILSMFDAAGTVVATCCDNCRRIFLHGIPK